MLSDLFHGNFYIQVQNAANSTLGVNGQGVCGVTLYFDHEFVGDLLITLTSPAGQSITLVGPTGFYGETDGTSWDITFVPCGVLADPDPGFAPNWSNAQPWGILGNYTGSYYPFDGCLEGFNTGPVNGQWTLSVTDVLSNDVGNFYDYSIHFCDPTGIDCFSCVANAGNLLQPDVTACAGDSSLMLQITPTYAPPQTAPPAAIYSYEYVIGSGGIIVGYEKGPDLSDYSPGSYTVCGLSYLGADSSKIPPPNGALTVTQLAAQLNSSTPPFCGKITSNCVNVNILPPVENVETFDTICAPDCAAYYGEQFCATGDYVVPLTQNGCSYIATLHLTVLQPPVTDLYETVCAGACAQTQGFGSACSTGDYSLAYPASNGCDSIVNLHLTVLDALASIQPPAALSCTQPSVVLNGSASTAPGPGVTYAWGASNGGALTGPANQNTATAAAAGVYQLAVCIAGATALCCDTATVSVQTNQNPPMAPVLLAGPVIACSGDTVKLKVSPVANADTYHWAVPSNAVISAGQGTDSITLFWNTQTADSICVSAANACGSSDSICWHISVPAPATLPASLSGPKTVCFGDTVEYTVAPAPGALGHLWAASGGGIIIAGQGSDTLRVVWTDIGAGNLCVRAYHACDTSGAACLDLEVLGPPAAPVLVGPDSVCAGATATYLVADLPGAAGFDWKITGGTLLTVADSTAVVVLWDSGVDTGEVCVGANNACGNSALKCKKITVSPLPAANAGPDQSFCGLEGHLKAVPNPLSDVGFWSMQSGPGAVAFTDSLLPDCDISVTQPGKYIFVWTEQKGLCTGADTSTADFHALPVIGPASFVCDSVGESYKVLFGITGGTPPYSANANTLAGNQFASAPIPSGGNYAWKITDKNGCVSDTLSGSHSCACISAAGQMSNQMLTACAGDVIQVQPPVGSMLDPNDTMVFVLHTSSTDSVGKVWAMNSNGQFELLPGMIPGQTYYVSAIVGNHQNGQINTSDPCLSKSVGQPVVFYGVPTADAGPDTAVCGAVLQLAGGGGNGAWSLSSTTPGSGLSIANANAANTTVSSSMAGTFTLRWTVTENGCTGTDETTITFFDSIAIKNLSYQCDSTNEHYTVHFTIAGGQPPYSIDGLKIPGDTYTSTSFVNSTLYTLTIGDNKTCIPVELEGSHNCDCASKAGIMSDSLLQICEGDSVAIVPAESPVLDGNDVVSFILHTADDASPGQILAENGSGIFGFTPGMKYGVTYFVSQVVGTVKNGLPDPDDPCRSISPGQPVVFTQRPKPYAGPDTSICGTGLLLAAGAGAFPGKWTTASGTGNALFGVPDTQNSEVLVSLPGTYTFRWTEQNGTCTGFDEVQVVFHPPPVLTSLETLCNLTNTAFTVSFKITGGTPPFAVDGLNGLLNGDIFLSLPLVNNSSFAFYVKDAAGCSTPAVSGNNHCQCSTSAGTMDTSPISVCINQPAIAKWNNDAAQDPDDAIKFVLHDSPAPSLGTILAVGDTPAFPFAANLKTGVTYYISAVAGNTAGNGLDWSDPCLSVSPGAPVQWRPLPEAAFSGDTVICSGQSATLHVKGNGAFPLHITFLENGLPKDAKLLDSVAQAIAVSPVASTYYVLTSVAENGPGGCARNLADTVFIEVIAPPHAGEALDSVIHCSGDSALIELPIYLKDADAGGKWRALTPGLSASSILDEATGLFRPAGLAAGTYQFSYRLEGVPPCATDSTILQVVLRMPPLADAGADRELDCTTTMVALGGNATSTGHGESYQWYLGNLALPDGDSSYLIAESPGLYRLQVTDPYGCKGLDDVWVSQPDPPLIVDSIAVVPIRCFGEQNGVLQVISVIGGTPPVLFSLNDGPFTPVREYTHLPPGTYWLTAQDAAGCEWSSGSFLLVQPPEIKISLGDDLEAALGDSVYLVVEGSAPWDILDTVIWTPLLDLSSAGKLYQRFVPLHSGRIGVTVRDTNGCAGTDAVTIRVNRERRVYLPNAFRPDQTTNGRFILFGGPDVVEVEVFKVFDRWGECLFDAAHFLPDNPDYGWDGVYKGRNAPPGVYGYFAVVRFLDGKQETFSGSVTLLR